MSDVDNKILESAPQATPKVESNPNADTPNDAPKAEAPKVEAPPAKEELKPEAAKPVEGDKPQGEKKEPEGDKKEPEKVVPEKYDFKLQDDSPLDSVYVENFERIAKERGLSQEEAQAELSRQEAQVSDTVSRFAESWKTQAQNDPEIGGAKFEENVNYAHSVIQRFGSDGLKAGLNKSGYGNHPELIRMLAKIGRAMSDDTLVRPGSSLPTKEKTLEELFYPGGMKTHEG